MLEASGAVKVERPAATQALLIARHGDSPCSPAAARASSSARRNSAATVGRGEREPTSWESENLETCRASQLARSSGFQLFALARCGRAGARRPVAPRARTRSEWPRGAVRAATWRTGNLEPWECARRGAGRRGPDVARSARVGRARAAAVASPVAMRRASRVPRVGTRLRRVPARVLANACSTGNRSRVVGALHRGFTGCDIASAHRRTIASRCECCPYSGVKCRILYEISSGCPQARRRSLARWAQERER